MKLSILSKIEHLFQKKWLLIALLGIFFMVPFYMQDVEPNNSQQEEQNIKKSTSIANSEAVETAKYKTEESLHAQIKTKFIEGDPIFMAPVLLTLILGLALAIERIIYLNMASSTDTRSLLMGVEEALKTKGVEGAKEVCRNTAGPIASIFYQGLDRADEGIDVVEKSVISYGGVQAGLLEKNLSWISLFIALAPMLGFLGTVIGMISAFDAIEAAGDISATVVAGGIKIALLTTVAGLIAAIILQIFYNAILAKIDNIVNNMEDASISLVDLIVRFKKK